MLNHQRFVPQNVPLTKLHHVRRNKSRMKGNGCDGTLLVKMVCFMVFSFVSYEWTSVQGCNDGRYDGSLPSSSLMEVGLAKSTHSITAELANC